MTSDGFVAETSRQRDGFTVRWRGEVDLLTAPGAVDSVARLDLDVGCSVRLCLDTVTFIDSTGVRALLDVRQHVKGSRAHLELIDPSPRVVRVLELAGLVDLLDLDGHDPSSVAG